MKKLAYPVALTKYLPEISGLMNWIVTSIITIIFYLCPANSINGQNSPHPSFRQFTTNDGLASSEVYHILQDRDGFIWISSDNGVSRFDGYQFRNYGMKDGLVENVIFMMQLDSTGRLWMQAMSGKLYYMEGDSIHPYWNNNVIENYKTNQDSQKGFIVEGSGERVHVSTNTFGVATIFSNGTTSTTTEEEPVYRYIFEKNGIIINVSNTHGDSAAIASYRNIMTNQKIEYPVYFQNEKEEWVFKKLHYSKKKVLSVEAFRLNANKYLLQLYDDVWLISNGNAEKLRSFPHRILYAKMMDDGSLLLGLHFHNGLQHYPSIDAFQKKEVIQWLPDKSISHIIKDKEEGMWIATNENGVFYSPPYKIMVYDQESGLSDDKIMAIALKNESEIYVGLGNGQVWHLNKSEQLWKTLPMFNSENIITDLRIDRKEGNLWVARDQLYYLQNNAWVKINMNYPNSITESSTGSKLWVGNSRSILSIEAYTKRIEKISELSERGHVVIEDLSGRVWSGQSDGLYELKNGALIKCDNLHPVFSLRVEDICVMLDSTLVIATKGGGLVFWKDDKFEQITSKNGLTADMMECVYTDENSVVWAGTLNGLNRISGTFENRKVEQITVFHGLPSNEINDIKVSGDDVWVATNKGLAHFKTQIRSTYSPQPILSSMMANNHSINLTKPIELLAKENNLAINFTTINFKMNGDISYRYRMVNQNWDTTLNRTLIFPALASGEHLFEVQSQNEDGIWSVSTSLEFVIKPPWWNSLWAKLLVLISLLIATISYYRYRTMQLKLAHETQLQIANLERSALQAQMNPHFIFNCLNSIQNFILQNEKESAIQYLGSFASLVRSMLNASVSGKISLAEEVKLLNNYLSLEKLRFKTRFNYEIKTEEGMDLHEIRIPPLLVQPYIENALIHGISKKKNNGKVDVFFEQKESYLQVSVIDNGEGMKLDHLAPDNSESHKSFGMSITKNRLELLSANKTDEHVITNTLYNETGQVVGNQIIIKIGINDSIDIKIN